MSDSASHEQDVLKLLASGMSERKVADTLGMSRRRVSKIKQNAPMEVAPDPLSPDLLPTMSRATAIAELVKLSTQPGGVRYSEMWSVLRALFGMRINDKTGMLELDMTDNQLRYLKEKTTAGAADQGKVALFIPEWLPRQAPVAANDMLVSRAGWLHDRAQEYAAEFMLSFPGASMKHVFNELVCLAFKQASPEPVQTRCQRNAETAEVLQRRLGALAGKPAANEPFPLAPDPELDRLCI
ncbi:helix-turn-helix domain-containing protein [Pseudomonas sp. ML96]|uniref:helix-turn-helix domain-containing protein n=1 Tax=Pseudomonas sp. ML96 TaxID=1523503 RepID=UPI0012E01E75|nr:helix-turn-helix domain-containing protein [Pseudomonas sp. ML96]